MRTMRKKPLSTLILGILVLACLLAGCSSPSAQSSAPASAPASQPAASPSDAPASEDPSAGSEPVHLTVVTTGMTSPYSYFDEDNNLAGSEIDLWNEIAARTGYEIEFITADFEGIINALDSGMADVGSNCLGWTEQRAEKYQCSDPYLYQGQYMCVREDDDSIQEISDLVGKVVACSSDSIQKAIIDEWCADNGKEGQVEYLLTTTGSFMLEVNLGRADCTFSQPVNFNTKMATGEFQLKLVGDPVYEEQAVFLFSKDVDPQVVATVNETIAEMRADGFLSTLYTEKLGVDLSESSLS